MITDKVQPHHLERKALLYVRRSSAHLPVTCARASIAWLYKRLELPTTSVARATRVEWIAARKIPK